MIKIKRRLPRCAKSLKWWPCRFLPTTDGDGAVGFVLKISSFVIGSFKNLDCYAILGNSVITRL
jgi:hypothetical protein